MPRTLRLVEHGRPRFLPGVPAHGWPLAEGALDGLAALAARLTPVPELVVSSFEPKAHATAAGLAAHLGVRHRPMHGLHERLRYTAPFHTDPAPLHPDRIMSGEGSADDARTRFGNAVDAVLAANPHGSMAVVAHAGGLDPWPLWQGLGLLEAVTVDVPGLRVREPTA